MRKRPAQILASLVGLAMLLALILGATWAFAPAQDFKTISFLILAFAIPFALAAWSGLLFREKGSKDPVHIAWKEWLAVFAGGAVVSAIFVTIDLLMVHPGIGLVFTIGAIALTAIALPSALRAWLLERWTSR